MRLRSVAVAFSLALLSAAPCLRAIEDNGGTASKASFALQSGTADDGVARLIRRLEQIVQRGDAVAYKQLLADDADRERAAAFIDSELLPGVTRAVVQERDRAVLAGTIPGNGYTIVVDIFGEFGDRSRISTWSFGVKRTGLDDAASEWVVVDQERLSSIENLYRLSMNPAKQFAVDRLKLVDGDLTLVLVEGAVFVSEIDQGPTAVVFVGEGEMTFQPRPEAEKSQVRIFSGSDAIATRLDAAYLRMNPVDFDRLLGGSQLVPAPVDQAAFRKADRIFREISPKSFTVDLGDLSRDTWSFVPSPPDLIAELYTRRFDTLTYSRSSSAAEDITLFHREDQKTIALYASSADRQNSGADRGEKPAEFTVRHYDIDISSIPDRRWLDGRARLSIEVEAPISNLTLRLAEPLAIQSVFSDEYGRLFSMRIKGQSTFVVSLPRTLSPGTELTLTVKYSGRLEPDTLDTDAAASQVGTSPLLEPPAFDAPEPSVLYSGQSNWYPRPAGSRHATATLRITVPATMSSVGSGEPDANSPMLLPADGPLPIRKQYVFYAALPVRYFAFVVSRFATSQSDEIRFAAGPVGDGASGGSPTLAVSVEANPGHGSRGRDVADRAADIVRYYESLLHDSPYPTFTVALTENLLAGGHSPGYFAVLNVPPLPQRSFPARNDPATFDGFPDFFLAHETAHQWWGQAVGWRSYHEQWLSEGFAQYFAALYARHRRGEDVFRGMLRQMRRWAVNQRNAGPISLGSRLGHLQGDSRILRALVYDKGALVLHMLRQLTGDEAFFRGLQRFYRESRFSSVGTDDFRRAMETEAGRPLSRFFDGWVYGSSLPRLDFSYRIEGSEAILHMEQRGELFDLPLVVTLQYADGRTDDRLVAVTDRIVDIRLPLDGRLRGVDVSRDQPPLAEVSRN
jgi:hypothetical protein